MQKQKVVKSHSNFFFWGGGGEQTACRASSNIILWFFVNISNCCLVKVQIPKIIDILLTVHLSIIFSLFPTWYTAFLSTYNICYLLSSTCFRPHRPIIRRSKLYMQPVVLSPAADVFVVRPLGKASAEGESTIGCMYNLDLLMMGLWGLKHVEERR